MAILNVTPDSFSDGGRLSTRDSLLAAAENAIQSGASILDIGGESTRPGAKMVTIDQECERVLPAIDLLHGYFPDITLSIDTRKAKVAEAAVKAGARMINDVSGLTWDPDLVAVARRYQTELVLMHSQGTPENMQQNPHYSDVVSEVSTALLTQASWATQQGVAPDKIILDPGFGFGKTLQHNLALFKALPCFCRQWPYPVLVGCSRKQFLTLEQANIAVEQRDYLTAASVAFSVQAGVSIIRVHHVDAMGPVFRFALAVRTQD